MSANAIVGPDGVGEGQEVWPWPPRLNSGRGIRIGERSTPSVHGMTSGDTGNVPSNPVSAFMRNDLPHLAAPRTVRRFSGSWSGTFMRMPRASSVVRSIPSLAATHFDAELIPVGPIAAQTVVSEGSKAAPSMEEATQYNCDSVSKATTSMAKTLPVHHTARIHASEGWAQLPEY